MSVSFENKETNRGLLTFSISQEKIKPALDRVFNSVKKDIDEFLHRSHLVGAGKRPEGHPRIGGPAQAETSQHLGNFRGELRRDPLMHQKPVRGNTHLAGTPHFGHRHRLGGLIHVGTLAHQVEGIAVDRKSVV